MQPLNTRARADAQADNRRKSPAIPLPRMGARKDGATRYQCSLCRKPFLIEEHGQRHCSPRCKRKHQRLRPRATGRCGEPMITPDGSVSFRGYIPVPARNSQPGILAKSDAIESRVFRAAKEGGWADLYASAEATLPCRPIFSDETTFLPADEYDLIEDETSDRARRRHHEVLIADAVDKARAADLDGTLRSRVAAKHTLAVAIALRAAL